VANPVAIDATDEATLSWVVEAAPRPKRPKAERPPRKLLNAHRIAFEAFEWACEQNPTLRTDRQVYAWLMLQRKFEGKLPPSCHAFCRYVREGRRFITKTSKREQRRRWRETLLNDAQRFAFCATEWACAQKTSLKSDKQVYEWLQTQPEFRERLPALEAFRRDFSQARKIMGGIAWGVRLCLQYNHWQRNSAATPSR
jgi:hypothetical protein